MQWMHGRAARVHVVPAAVPILREGVVHPGVEPLVRNRLVKRGKRRPGGRGPTEQLAPRKFALPDLHY